MPRPPTNPPPIGPILRALREERGLTQEELARKARVHRNYIGGVERGERNPTLHSIAKLLDVLRVSWTDLGRALDQARESSLSGTAFHEQ